jgi:hypothetical protein
MTHWQLGEQEEARKYFDHARSWMEQNRPDDIELTRFRREAEDLLSVTEPTNVKTE